MGPGTLTHLGAGMSTGKSTEIYREMISLAHQKLGKGIIAVPRVSLARFLAHYLRQQHGFRAWDSGMKAAGTATNLSGVAAQLSACRLYHEPSNAHSTPV